MKHDDEAGKCRYAVSASWRSSHQPRDFKDDALGARRALSRLGIGSPDFDASRQMMKIDVNELDHGILLRVEGRVAGAFVPELENCWNVARASQPNWKISVDLKNVTCVDRAGRNLLQLMYSNGVEFVRAGMAIQDILEQVMERKCGP